MSARLRIVPPPPVNEDATTTRRQRPVTLPFERPGELVDVEVPTWREVAIGAAIFLVALVVLGFLIVKAQNAPIRIPEARRARVGAGRWA